MATYGCKTRRLGPRKASQSTMKCEDLIDELVSAANVGDSPRTQRLKKKLVERCCLRPARRVAACKAERERHRREPKIRKGYPR